MVTRAVILAIRDKKHRSKLTYNRAPAMLPALGKPLIARIIERLYQAGIHDLTVVVGENEGEVASYLNKFRLPNVKLKFILKLDNQSFLSIFKMVIAKDQSPFMLATYNSFFHAKLLTSLLKSHEEKPDSLIIGGAQTSLSKSPHTMYATMHQNCIKMVEPSRDSEQNSIALIDAALCGSAFITYVQQQQNPTTTQFYAPFLELAHDYISQGGNAILAEAGWILQVNTDKDLLTLNRHLLSAGHDAHILSELPFTVKIIPPIRVDPQVSVGQGVTLGPNVYLERGSSIGHNTTLRNTIVLRNVNISANQIIEDDIVSSRGSTSSISHS